MDHNSFVISIDSGTQSTRVAIFDQKGNRLATGSAPHPAMHMPRKGWFEHGRGDSWNALCEASAKALAQFSEDRSKIVGISLSSQRNCVNIIGADTALIHDPISWMDTRWKMNYASIGALPAPPDDPLYNFYAYFSLANWMKYNDPQTYQNAVKYLNVSGYLSLRLTGECRDAIANNIGWPYDLTGWSGLSEEQYIELMGFRRDQLAQPTLPGGLLGHITAQAAAATGLPEGCPLFADGGDKQSELLGVGAVHDRQTYITLGTLSGMNVVSSEYKPSPTFSYMTYLAAYPKNYNYEAALGKGFWLVSWFRDNFGAGLREEAKARGTSIEALLDAEAELVAPGCNGLVLVPDWAPSTEHPHGKGMFIGMDERHGRAHMYRALIEGIVMELKAKADSMLGGLGIKARELYIGGGGSKSNFCAQAIADVFNLKVYRSQEPENCSLGSAMCAAVGAGLYPDLDAAIAGMIKGFDIFVPNPQNHALYSRLREKVVDPIYPAIEEVLKELAAIGTPV